MEEQRPHRKTFDILQNKLELDKPYVSDEDVFRGYLFASFIALILYYFVLNLLKKHEINDKVSVEDALFEFSKVMVEEGDCPPFAEIPAKVRKLAKNSKSGTYSLNFGKVKVFTL